MIRKEIILVDITLTQGILLSLLVFICAWDARWESFFIARPIVVSFFAGLILGDVKVGLAAGAVAELSYLGLLTVGGTVPPNPLMAGLMTTVLAYKTGLNAETTLGLSLPFALLMQWIVIACQSFFSGFNILLERAAKEGNTRKFTTFVFLPEFLMTTLYAIVAFLSAYALQDVLRDFVNSFPEFLTHGFEIAGGLLPAVGLGLLLKVMLKKENVPYFFIGFLMMTFLSLNNVLPIAIAGVAVAYVGFLNDKSKMSKVIQEGGEDDGI